MKLEPACMRRWLPLGFTPLSRPIEYGVVLVHFTEIVPTPSMFDVNSEALPKLSGVVETMQFPAIVAVQGEAPAFVVVPGFDEQFGLARR